MINKEKVRVLMKAQGIGTQTELAEKMQITKNQLSVLLSPKFDPIKANTRLLCNLLNVGIKDIIREKPENMYLEFDDLEEEVKPSKSVTDRYIDIRSVVPNKKYNVVELFAGAGGLALGLESAGFQSLGLVEVDKYACKTLRENRPHWNVIQEDIIKVTENGIKTYLPDSDPEIDLLSGGFPCQAFSFAGNKLGLNDVRGTMFYYYAKALEELKPKMFLAENVRGLVNHDEGKTLNTMINVFSEIGYTVQWEVLRAVNYHVSQKRERLVMVGIRNDLVNTVNYKFPKSYGYILPLRDVLKDTPKSEGTKYPESKRKVLDKVPPGGYWRDLPEDIAKEYMGKSYYSGGGRTGMARRLSWDEPSLTLTCSPAQKQTERCHPDETRPFNVREYARIQSFPDTWSFNCSVNNAYKQIGNAVPVNMAEAVGKSIIRSLNLLDS